MYHRNFDGSLSLVNSYPTGGVGSYFTAPDPLGSQNSLLLTPDGKWLLAVNAGKNEPDGSGSISVFQVQSNGLKLVDKVSSGGIMPVSLTISGDEVFVLNDGVSNLVTGATVTHGNITGFNLGPNGDLDPIWGSTRWLPVGGAQDFGQVGFDNTGNWLIVTDKADSNILVYSMGWDKMPAKNPVTYLDPLKVPFGFIFDARDNLIVVEAGKSAVSSYSIKFNGTLEVISQSISNDDSTACWIVGNDAGPIFTTNPGGPGTVASYKDWGSTGNITLLNSTAAVDGPFIDEGISNDGMFLYGLSPFSGIIYGFKVSPNGNLTSWGTYATGDTSGYVQGMAVR